VSRKWNFEKGLLEQLGMEYLILRSKMMKKLLTFMLVLGIASSANATLSLVSSAGLTLDPMGVSNPSITVIGIYNDTAEPGQGKMTYLGIPAGSLGQWTGNATINVPPALGGTNTYYGVVDPGTGIGTNDLWESNLGVASVNPYGIGVLAGYEFMCTGAPGDVVITLYADDIATPISSITIHQVPEPITFGLLGLGGLFLRRRK
jgi:hypothetical protein